jgi:hypothetical protein
MGRIIYFVRYSNAAASAFHWTNVDNKILVSRMAERLHQQNEKHGGDRKIDKVLEVEVIGEYKVRPAFGMHRIDGDINRKPKPGFRGNDGRTPCIDIRCLDDGGHFTDECPHKDESTPCEDKQCPVIGPHTTYNCHQVPRSQMICSDAGFCNVEGCYHKTAHEFVAHSCDNKGFCPGAPSRTEVCKPV